MAKTGIGASAESSQAGMGNRTIQPSHEVMLRVRHAFFRHGYADLSMVQLADACGFTRRTLYNYFRNKEDAFRALIRYFNGVSIRRGLEAGEAVRAKGGSAVDVLTEIMDVRFGDTRRDVQNSAHTVELNAIAFMKCRDIMIDVAISFQRDIEMLLLSFANDGLIELTGEFTPAEMSQTLCNGARGVNQALPPPHAGELNARYRQMCHAVLFGCARAVAAQDFSRVSALRTAG